MIYLSADKTVCNSIGACLYKALSVEIHIDIHKRCVYLLYITRVSNFNNSDAQNLKGGNFEKIKYNKLLIHIAWHKIN